MATWTAQELRAFGEPDEITIATMRKDGTLRKPVIVWIVRHGDDLYVRSVNGRDASWFRGVQSRHEGQVRGGGVKRDVTFVEETDPGINDRVDDAYREKYRRYPGIVPSMVTPDVRSTTLKLVP